MQLCIVHGLFYNNYVLQFIWPDNRFEGKNNLNFIWFLGHYPVQFFIQHLPLLYFFEIGACAVLHNLAIILREPQLDEDQDVDIGVIHGGYNGQEDGNSVRNYITRTYFGH